MVLPRQKPPISCAAIRGCPFRIGDAALYTASEYVPGGGGRPRRLVRRAYEAGLSQMEQSAVWRTVTWSKLILMLPTFVAPTGTIPKKPCFHRPRSATRSFSTKRFSSRFAMYGETEYSSPVMVRSLVSKNPTMGSVKPTYQQNAVSSPQPKLWDCGSDDNLQVQGR